MTRKARIGVIGAGWWAAVNHLPALKANKDCEIVAEVLVWANLRGVDSHGVTRIPSYLEYIRNGALDPRARPAMRVLTPSSFILDCAHSAGPVAMMQAAVAAHDSAMTSGICMGLVSATTHTGAIGRYAEWLAERNCAAIVFVEETAVEERSRKTYSCPGIYTDAQARAWRDTSTCTPCRAGPAMRTS